MSPLRGRVRIMRLSSTLAFKGAQGSCGAQGAYGSTCEVLPARLGRGGDLRLTRARDPQGREGGLPPRRRGTAGRNHRSTRLARRLPLYAPARAALNRAFCPSPAGWHWVTPTRAGHAAELRRPLPGRGAGDSRGLAPGISAPRRTRAVQGSRSPREFYAMERRATLGPRYTRQGACGARCRAVGLETSEAWPPTSPPLPNPDRAGRRAPREFYRREARN